MKISDDRRMMTVVFLREMADLIENKNIDINYISMHHNQSGQGETDNLKLGIEFFIELNAENHKEIEKKKEHLDLVQGLDRSRKV